MTRADALARLGWFGTDVAPDYFDDLDGTFGWELKFSNGFLTMVLWFWDEETDEFTEYEYTMSAKEA